MTAASRVRLFVVALGCALLVSSACHPKPEAQLRIGSKRFTESYVLAEIAAQVVRDTREAEPHLSPGLGGTAIVFAALESGGVDVYPEYTGTIAEVVFHLRPGATRADLEARLAARGLGMTPSLGFSNTYALAVVDRAERTRAVRRVSDLARAPGLCLGLSPEFLGRTDGWAGLADAYGLSGLAPRSVDHGLAYEAIASADLDVIDVYSTDAKIPRLGLRVLDDDRGFFPPYEAVFLYRKDARARFPRSLDALAALAGRLDAAKMMTLNARVDLDGATFADAARDFFRRSASAPREPWLRRLGQVIRDEGPRHLLLVLVSVALAALVGLPLGIFAAFRPRLGSALIAATGVLQTIPSLALLCFMIPLFGIGTTPALVALFLYALLPIIRSTAVGLRDIPGNVRELAVAVGLPWRARLVRVELPLASRAIFGGLKTSAVINVGTATLAAFIGAGGFGVPISTGLNLDDNGTILLGAVPAALLALLIEGAFDVAERFLVPEGLRKDGERGVAR